MMGDPAHFALDAAYPGGLRRLEQDWRQWLALAQKHTHQI